MTHFPSVNGCCRYRCGGLATTPGRGATACGASTWQALLPTRRCQVRSHIGSRCAPHHLLCSSKSSTPDLQVSRLPAQQLPAAGAAPRMLASWPVLAPAACAAAAAGQQPWQHHKQWPHHCYIPQQHHNQHQHSACGAQAPAPRLMQRSGVQRQSPVGPPPPCAAASSSSPFPGPDGWAGDASGRSSFLSAFWRFLRPHTIRGTILGTSAVVSKVLLTNAAAIDWGLLPRALLGLVALLCGNGYIVGINQIYDVDIDAVNKPFLPVAAGAVVLVVVAAFGEGRTGGGGAASCCALA